MDVCILTSLDKGNPLVDKCIDTCLRLNGDVQVLYDKLPEQIDNQTLYISFLGDVIIPKDLIADHMYNTHPGPPWYRGWGSRLRSILDKQRTHGVTLHRVAEIVDTGDIYKVNYFDVSSAQSTDSIHSRAEKSCLKLVIWLVDCYLDGNVPEIKVAEWSGTFMYKDEYFRLNIIDSAGEA